MFVITQNSFTVKGIMRYYNTFFDNSVIKFILPQTPF